MFGAWSMTEPKQKRARLLQEDVPAHSLEQALRVPRGIAENYAYKPTRSMNVAAAMKVSPTSSTFRTITGAALAYGLTTGAAQAPEIGITPLGMRIVRPTMEGDDVAATREALLRPKIIGEFLRTYDGAALPSDTIAKNVLQEKGVPADRLDDVLQLIVDGATFVGLIRELNGKRYVDLAADLVAAENGVDESIGIIDNGDQTVSLATTGPTGDTRPANVSITPGVHVNIQIHIAADAPSETIEEIFRNMRRYVLNSDGELDHDASSTK